MLRDPMQLTVDANGAVSLPMSLLVEAGMDCGEEVLAYSDGDGRIVLRRMDHAIAAFWLVTNCTETLARTGGRRIALAGRNGLLRVSILTSDNPPYRAPGLTRPGVPAGQRLGRGPYRPAPNSGFRSARVHRAGRAADRCACASDQGLHAGAG